MPPDLTRDLPELAPSPSAPLDVDAMWARGLRLRRRRRMAFAAGAMSVVAIAGVMSAAVDLTGDGGRLRPEPAVSPTETPGRTDHDYENLAAEIRSQRRALRDELRRLVETETEMRRRLRPLRAAGETQEARRLERSAVRVDARIAELVEKMTRLLTRLRAVEGRSDR